MLFPISFIGEGKDVCSFESVPKAVLSSECYLTCNNTSTVSLPNFVAECFETKACR